MGPKEARSTVLTPLDDVLFTLQPQVPNLTRSSLHRLLERHGISRLPEDDSAKSEKKRFKSYPIGFFHIDIAEARCKDGKLFLYVAIDRTSKFAYAELHAEATRSVATQMLRNLIETVPHRIHSFDIVCLDNDIEHRLTQPSHPWTNGQVERMNRTIKDATVRTFHYASADELKQHLQAFLLAYNCARRLKTLKGRTLYEFVCHQWTIEPKRFELDPSHHEPGLNIAGSRTSGG